MWSKKAPTKDGWYWVDTNGHCDVYPVRVEGDKALWDGGWHDIDEFAEWYSEPIAMPAKPYKGVIEDVQPQRMTQDMLIDWSGLY